jgi:hypothetical protein
MELSHYARDRCAQELPPVLLVSSVMLDDFLKDANPFLKPAID